MADTDNSDSLSSANDHYNRPHRESHFLSSSASKQEKRRPIEKESKHKHQSKRYREETKHGREQRRRGKRHSKDERRSQLSHSNDSYSSSMNENNSYSDSDSIVSNSSKSNSDDDLGQRKNSKRKKRSSHHFSKRKQSKEKSRKSKKSKSRKRDRDSINGSNGNENKNIKQPNTHKRRRKKEKRNAAITNIPHQSQELLNSLLNILKYYPDMSNQILLMLRQMSGSGTSFDLSQMTNSNVSHALEKVFVSLRPYGVRQKTESTKSSVWYWNLDKNDDSGIQVQKQWDEFLLIKIIKSLLDQAGLTIEAIADYETKTNNASQVEFESSVEKTSRNDNQSESNKSTTNSTAKSGILQPSEISSSTTALTTNTPTSNASSEIQEFTHLLLSNFGESASTSSSPSSSLPSLGLELSQLCNHILEGEILSLDGIPNLELKMGLKILFTRAGLDYCEMEDMEENDCKMESKNKNKEDEGNGNKEDITTEKQNQPCMGFGLPDLSDNEYDNSNGEQVKSNMRTIIQACYSYAPSPSSSPSRQEQNNSKTGTSNTDIKPAIKGPFLPESTQYTSAHSSINNKIDDESSEEEGPTPAGSLAAKRRDQIGPRIPANIVKEMAVHRMNELNEAKVVGTQNMKTQKEAQKQALSGQAREEWMMKPGEHDFLQGIVKSGTVLKNRKFKNEKQRPNDKHQHGEGPPAISERLQKQMDEMIDAHNKARGPSLIEQHRKQKAEEKKHAAMNQGGKNEWNWSKNDLDAGRRVDKKALGQILGGAAKGLSDKFQGSISRGFM